MLKEHIVYTDKQKDSARQTDIIDFLERFEGFTFKKAGKLWRCNEHSSLVIQPDRKGWYWNSQNVGGDNAIAYCQKIKNMNFPETLQALVGNGEIKLKQAPVKSAEADPQELVFSLPSKADNCKRAFAYLNQNRCIDACIISELMHKKLIYQDNKNNVVFVGINEQSEPKYACIRGTLSDVSYRGEVLGSNKEYSFSVNASNGNNKSKVYIFESPIDLLSHATLANKIIGKEKAWTVHNRISLGGTSDVALEHYLSTHPEIKELMLCLDNDEAGRKASTEIKAKYEAKGYSVTYIPPKHKDYNEDLKAYVHFPEPKLTECKPPAMIR